MSNALELPRRVMIRRIVGALMAGTAISGLQMASQMQLIEVTRLDIPVRGLDSRLAGVRIGHISDLHASAEVPAAHIAETIRRLTAERVDMIAVTGDFISSGTSYVRSIIDSVGALRAPLGVFAVLGNRDHSSGVADALTHGLGERGVQVLRNQSVSIAGLGARLDVVGVDDLLMNKADPARAFSQLPEGGARILLIHEPDFADQAAQYSVSLQLSGHSHGGQVRIPLIGAIRLPPLARRFQIGLARIPSSDAWVYTNRGIGTIAPHIRFNCRPEITVLRLVQA